VHSDDQIRKNLKLFAGTSFIDVIGPNDIAYVIAVFKNSKDMWDQDIRMREAGKDAMATREKKMKAHFTSGSGQKRVQGKSLWNKEGMRYFRDAEREWKEIYDRKEDMKVLYNGWEKWISVKGKELKVGDGSKKTFHHVMGSWSNEKTPESENKNDESEEEDSGDEGGYSSDRARSRHSVAWATGEIRDTKAPGGGREESSDDDEKGSEESSDDEEKGSEESSDDEEKDSTGGQPKTPERGGPPLFSVSAASLGRGSPAACTRSKRGKTNAEAEAEGKDKKKRKRN